ncbi:flagellar brake protein [Oceanobacillus locisalsi]|uniref:Flagellar brake protein n=1 Tax=Oceanobacillus locisalsi TaxID=546107 RepID=A0ABW3NBG4_9BACI
MNEKEYTGFWDGQLLEIINADEKMYFTQLIRNEAELMIQRPVNKQNVPMLIENGMRVTVCFYEEEKGLCQFEAAIHYQNGKTSITKPDKDRIKFVQRREFFRVKAMEKMQVTLLPAEETDVHLEENKKETVNVTTHDISGGGVAFLTRSKLAETGDKVTGILFLKTRQESQTITFHGKIVNVMKQPNGMMKHAIEFIEMREGIRSKIIQFCISKQIEIRNKLKE